MDLSIRHFFNIVTVILLTVMLLFMSNIVWLKNINENLKDVEENRYLITLIADELRQTSDDLTRFARIYVITKDIQYKNNYYEVLNIRKGNVSKPEEYFGLYWDLIEPLRSIRHPRNKKQSLMGEAKMLFHSGSIFENKFGLEKLQEAEFHSDSLVNLEVEAFNAIDGLFKNNNGDYIIHKKADQKLAINLLHSKKYYQKKQKIMLSIDEFLTLLNARTKNKILFYNSQKEKAFSLMYVLSAAFFLVLMSIHIIIRKKILEPVKALKLAILHFKQKDKGKFKFPYFDDEIGQVAKMFFKMKLRISSDYDVIKNLALKDPLTNINNRRAFFEISDYIFESSKRANKIFSIAILDVDFFKKINDNHGHMIGDEVLVLLAKALKGRLRKSDVLARFGGEEFIVLLPNTNMKDGIKILNDLKQTIEDSLFTKQNISLTISIGAAQLTNENTLKELIAKADRFLYQAKDEGRNTVAVE